MLWIAHQRLNTFTGLRMRAVMQAICGESTRNADAWKARSILHCNSSGTANRSTFQLDSFKFAFYSTHNGQTDRMIPDDIRDFILQRLDSVAEMEALLLLWRDPGKDWDTATLARELYITEADVCGVLRQLREQNLVEESNGFYRYWRSSAESGMIVDRLAQLYKTHLITITNLMHSKFSSRIQEFADAFVLRKDK